MARVDGRRMTHHHEGELVVFLIGMRINKPWRPDLWFPVFTAMPKMLAELAPDPESGFLGYRLTLGAGGPLLVQYWSSADRLYAFASASDKAHRPAWAAFNRLARKSRGAVGIWHETFLVERAESVYAGMPLSGLALATEGIPVGSGGESAAERLGNGVTRAGQKTSAA